MDASPTRGGRTTRAFDYLQNGSVFTVDFDPKRRQTRREFQKYPQERSIDVAVVQLMDDGSFVDRRQLTEAMRRIGQRRRRREWQGVIVVVFIHGWQHDAEWGGRYFEDFRDVLVFLACREAERGGGNRGDRRGDRRVVGIYVGWDGKARKTALGPTLRRLRLPNPRFWNRYEAALRIGGWERILDPRRVPPNAACELVQQVTRRTKDPTQGKRSQLALMGHSMGGLILESTLLTLVTGGSGSLLERRRKDRAAPVQTRERSTSVFFPDAVISLNSAADAYVARRLIEVLSQREVSRCAAGGRVEYAPPLLISVTSSADTVTRRLWPAGMRLLQAKQRLGLSAKDSLVREFAPGETLRTVGHHPDLLTHDLRTGKRGGATWCQPKKTLDLGQEFHCLREPEPRKAATPTIVVDLPESRRDPDDRNDFGSHTRYRLKLRKPRHEGKSELLWNFQVPRHLIEDHADIFNFRSKALILALMQVSGAVASLARDWSDSFER